MALERVVRRHLLGCRGGWGRALFDRTV